MIAFAAGVVIAHMTIPALMIACAVVMRRRGRHPQIANRD